MKNLRTTKFVVRKRFGYTDNQANDYLKKVREYCDNSEDKIRNVNGTMPRKVVKPSVKN